MGDPGKLRKKFSMPSHPWQKTRIEEERVLMKDYGMKNKQELWKLNSKLRQFKSQIKSLIPRQDEQAQKEKQLLLAKLQRLNLIKENSIPEDILAITLKDVCERRLQTLVVKKGFARTIKQSRQMIVHEHIMLGDRKITSPSYLVTAGEELTIKVDPRSSFASDSNPEVIPADAVVKEEFEKAGLPQKKHEETKEKAKEEKSEEPKAEKKETKKEEKKSEKKEEESNEKSEDKKTEEK